MIEHIAVVGAGYMGGGIAQVFAIAGFDVVIADADPAVAARHLDRVRQEAEDFENRGLFEPGSAELVRKNLRAAEALPRRSPKRISSRRRYSNGLKSRAQCCAISSLRLARKQ